MKFIVTVDPKPDGSWVAECPSVPDCLSTGATKDEALANLERRIRDLVPERMGGETPLTIEIEPTAAHDRSGP